MLSTQRGRTASFSLFVLAAVGILCATHARGKIFSLCELARDLLYRHSIPVEQLAMWLCIAYYESTYNTSAVGPQAEDFGLLQISRLYWCDPRGLTNNTMAVNGTQLYIPNVCNISCSAFLDDDISDDVKCALTIFKEHQGFEDDGFKAWAVYPKCRRQEPLVPDWCFPQGTIPHNLSNRVLA